MTEEKNNQPEALIPSTPSTEEITSYINTELDDFIIAINKWRGIERLAFLYSNPEPDLQQVKDLIFVRIKEKYKNYGLTLSEEGKEKIQWEEDLTELKNFIIYNVN
jgi:hypothetical protein